MTLESFDNSLREIAAEYGFKIPELYVGKDEMTLLSEYPVREAKLLVLLRAVYDKAQDDFKAGKTL